MTLHKQHLYKNKQNVVDTETQHLKKFKYFRKLWHIFFGYRLFLKSSLKVYYGIHNEFVDKILFFLYHNRSKWWLPFIAGLLAGFSQPPIYAFFLLPIAFVVLVRSFDFATKKTDFFKISGLFSLGFSIVALYWPGFGTYIFGFPGYIMVCFSIGVVLLSALIPAFMMGICGIVGLRLPMFRRMALFASMWVIAEYLRGFTIFNFPFAFIGYSVGFWAGMFQSANVWGVLGISFLLVFWSLSFYPILFSQDKLAFIGIFRKFIVIQIVFIAIIIIGAVKIYDVKNEYYPHKVALIQGNGSVQNDFYDNYDIYSKLTYKVQEITNGDLDLIIWPEGVGVPYNLAEKPLDALKFSSFIKQNQTFIFNSLRREGVKFYNTMYSYTMPNFSKTIQDDGTPIITTEHGQNGKLLWHNKKFLVPYGEYIPLIGALKIGKVLARGANVGFNAGRTIATMETDYGNIMPLICYEITYSGKISNFKKPQAQYIVNITNDEWLGYSSGPFQHFVASRYRAVEEGLSVLRVSNNGFSAIIDPYGQVNSKRTKLFKRDVIISLIPKKSAIPTFFHFAGNIPLMLFVTLYTLYFLFLYYFQQNGDMLMQKITNHIEEKTRKKKDPKYIKRF